MMHRTAPRFGGEGTPPLYVKEVDEPITPVSIVLAHVRTDIEEVYDVSNPDMRLNLNSVKQLENPADHTNVYVEFELLNVKYDTCMLRGLLKERWGDGVVFNNIGGRLYVNWGVVELEEWGERRAGYKKVGQRSSALPSMSLFWHFFYNSQIRTSLLLLLIAYLFYCFVVRRINDDAAWTDISIAVRSTIQLLSPS